MKLSRTSKKENASLVYQAAAPAAPFARASSLLSAPCTKVKNAIWLFWNSPTGFSHSFEACR